MRNFNVGTHLYIAASLPRPLGQRLARTRDIGNFDDPRPVAGLWWGWHDADSIPVTVAPTQARFNPRERGREVGESAPVIYCGAIDSGAKRVKLALRPKKLGEFDEIFSV